MDSIVAVINVVKSLSQRGAIVKYCTVSDTPMNDVFVAKCWFLLQDYVELKNFMKSNFHKDLHNMDLSVKGWNWGDLEFQDSLMSFNIESKAAFQVPMNEISQVNSFIYCTWTH